MSGNRMRRGIDAIKILFNIEKDTYEKLMKLKIAEGDNSSFTMYLNKKLAGVVNENRVLINGYEVSNVDNDFE